MRMFVFSCPRTGGKVEIGIGPDHNPFPIARVFSIRVRCPCCEDLHEWRLVDRKSFDKAPAVQDISFATPQGVE